MQDQGITIDWDKIPDAKPPDGFVPPVVYKVDPFMCDDEENSDGLNAIQTWIGTDGAGCKSAEEFLLKAAVAGCDEEWFSIASSRGFPLVSCLQTNPRLIADLIRSTKVFDWAVGQGLGFWNLKRSIDRTVGALNTPEGLYTVMEAYFEKALRAKKQVFSGV